MNIEIKQIKSNELYKYSKIPISFEVKSILTPELIDSGLGGIRFKEVNLENTYIKDYDSIPNNSPNDWEKNFNLKNWVFFMAFHENKSIAGSAVNLDFNEIAILWDIRVLPEYRGKGIGKKIYLHTLNQIKNKGCKILKIETQNTNIDACKFYKKMGCKLSSIDILAYFSDQSVKDEIMLNWHYKF